MMCRGVPMIGPDKHVDFKWLSQTFVVITLPETNSKRPWKWGAPLETTIF